MRRAGRVQRRNLQMLAGVRWPWRAIGEAPDGGGRTLALCRGQGEGGSGQETTAEAGQHCLPREAVVSATREASAHAPTRGISDMCVPFGLPTSTKPAAHARHWAHSERCSAVVLESHWRKLGRTCQTLCAKRARQPHVSWDAMVKSDPHISNKKLGTCPCTRDV